ncbi:F-box protein CPR1-like [Apium graveolens]|uniref:F-box protein CPR1-like n=1 Tax=Apium graveolens TaxID=4045 RepID=UPI003D7A7DAD
MESLADDIKNKILVRCPIKTLCILNCVSKALQTLIKSPDFTKHYDKLHCHHTSIKLLVVANSGVHSFNNIHHKLPSYSLAFQTNTRLVGSSNGLVCLYHSPGSLSLFNPATREFRDLPDPGTFTITSRIPIRLFGFSYVQVLDDFMVVSAAMHKYGLFPPIIKVYSARSDSWKTMPARPRGVKVPLDRFTSDFSVNVNDVAYWLGWSGSDGNHNLSVRKILGFDFALEEFKTLLLHDDINQSEIMAFTVLDGCICVLSPDAYSCLGMWVMKECGVVESWTKTYSLNGIIYMEPNTSVSPICNAGNKVLFEIDNQLVLYDPVKTVTTELEAGLPVIMEREGRLDFARYVESLVSPSGYICQDKRQIAKWKRMNE